MFNSSPIFICGQGSSGTTLLTALLDDHPQILVLPTETYYLEKVSFEPLLTVADGLNWILTTNGRKYAALSKSGSMYGYVDHAIFDLSSIREQILVSLQGGKQTHGRLLEAVAAAYAQESGQLGKKYWVEKTPGNEHHLHLPMAWYSDIRAIYIVRDPRDVYLSHARKMRTVSKSSEIEDFICRWGLSVWAWLQYTAINGDGLTIRYEDLLRYPKETLGLVCRFLEIEYTVTLEIPTKNSVQWVSNSLHGDKFATLNTKPIGRWREGLDGDEVALIEAYLGKTMNHLGYQLETGSHPLSKVFTHWFRRKRKRKQLLGMLMRLYWPFQLPGRFAEKRNIYASE